MKIGIRFLAILYLAAPCMVLAGCTSSPSSSSGGGTTTQTTPSVVSITPAKVGAGAAVTTLTVNGTNFTSTSSIQVGGVVEATSYGSATRLTATVLASQLASGSLLPVVVLNGSSTSASGTVINLEVDNPVPAITQFLPSSFTTGAASTTISVTGTGFVPTTTIQVNGSARSTTFVSATQVNVILTATDLASAGSLTLVAVNVAPGGGSSAAASVPVNNPVPTETTLNPSVVITGTSSTTTITVTGTNFLPISTVQVGTSSRTTTYVSATQLTFTLTVADQATAGRLAISVVTPSPGGGTSAALTLTIATATPTPVLTSVNPSTIVVGSAATSLLVQGTNFTANSIVQWNGTALATTYYSSTYLYGSVPVSLLATLGTANVTVTSPTAVVPVSNALSVSITNPPVPTLTAVSPGGAPLSTATTVTLTGTGFTSASTVQFDGVGLTAKYVSSTSLSVTIPASALSLLGNHSFTVTAPAPGGGTSGSLPFTAYIGIPNNAMALNPVSGLLYVSVPSSAGAPYGNSVVSVDPATGSLGTPIPVGSEPNKLAISSDGTTLWVGLDGASAVRMVNLTTGVAGLQFSLGDNAGTYNYPPIVHAIRVLPGTTTSIVASITSHYGLYNDLLAIFDNGVQRTNTAYLSTISTLPAIAVNSSKAEVYATSYESGYQVFTYNAAGLTALAGNTGTNNYNSIYGTALQVDNGRAYLDTGQVLNSETGMLLGTYYTTGTTAATGPDVSDSSLGKSFILNGTSSYGGGFTAATQIQAFNQTTFIPVASSIIPFSGALSGTKYGSQGSSDTTLNGYNNIDTLLRWGSNGLVFRASNGVFSFRSNVVQDLSATNADLAVTAAGPATAATGSTFTVTSTVTNNGPAAASAVTLSETIPANTTLVSASSSRGTCAATTVARCNLNALANGANATVTLTLQAMSAGSAAVTVSVLADQNDPASSNNVATATTTVSGNSYAAVPAIATLSPNAAVAGSTDVTLTLTGTGFVSNSVVYLGATSLSTTYVSSTQVMAIVPASQITALGWLAISVSSPAPGGGTSNVMPFSVYQVVNLTANHLIADPYSRNLYASVNGSATQVTGNSIISINPGTGALGTPVVVGSQPTALAETDDGQYLYVDQTGSMSVGRFNLLTQTYEFSFPITAGANYYYTSPALRGIATLPGSDTTVAVDEGLSVGVALWDVNATQKTGTQRGSSTGTYNGSSPQFLNAATLFTFDTDTTGAEFYRYGVSATGLSGSYTAAYTLNNFSAFKIRAGLAYANNGGVANPAVTPVALGCLSFLCFQYIRLFSQPNHRAGSLTWALLLCRAFHFEQHSGNYSERL